MITYWPVVVPLMGILANMVGVSVLIVRPHLAFARLILFVMINCTMVCQFMYGGSVQTKIVWVITSICWSLITLMGFSQARNLESLARAKMELSEMERLNKEFDDCYARVTQELKDGNMLAVDNLLEQMEAILEEYNMIQQTDRIISNSRLKRLNND